MSAARPWARRFGTVKKQKIPFLLILGDKDLANGTGGVLRREQWDIGPRCREKLDHVLA